MSETTPTKVDGRSRTWFTSTRQPAPASKGGARKWKETLTRDFLRGLSEDFAEHGPATIRTVRETDPGKYLSICATVLPKELDIRTDAADPERLEAQLSLLEAIIEERRAAKDITATVQVIGNADD